MQNDPIAGAGAEAVKAAPRQGHNGGPPIDPADDRCLPARAVRERYGVSDMTIWRWLDDPELKFPRPFYIGRLRYWKLSALLGWERQREGSAA